MPLRPTLPVDDLYQRLGVPTNASPEAIEVAWRGLLRKHHPDIAGQDALELAKRINVAHDWLSSPTLRRQYDEQRGVRPPAGSARLERSAWSRWSGEDAFERFDVRRRARSLTTAERAGAVVARLAHLTGDELDRLALAEPAPIAFLATLRRFARPDLQAILDDSERAALATLPAGTRRHPAVRDAIVGRLAEIVLDDALDGLLGESGADRARERLTRGWDAAVGQPRYGPATPAIGELLDRLRGLDGPGRQALARTGSRERLGTAPWPPSVSPDEDEALRVSSDLAGADAAAALTASGDAPDRVAAA
ncbi:MAG: J domain-containing protein, partial [Chloroflexi bacterium]|nr:J domain-containing protein [Chloroflexota bacterium]